MAFANIVRDIQTSTLRQEHAEALAAKTGTVLQVIDFAVEGMRGGAQQLPSLAGEAKTRIVDQQRGVMQKGGQIMDQLDHLPQHFAVQSL